VGEPGVGRTSLVRLLGQKLTSKEGDRILFGKYAGTEVKIEGEEHLIMKEDDVLGIIQ
jgi:chaperonin GroES